MEKNEKQICSIQVVFPVESDELAIICKKKITDLLDEIPDAQLQFRIMTSPTRQPMG